MIDIISSFSPISKKTSFSSNSENLTLFIDKFYVYISNNGFGETFGFTSTTLNTNYFFYSKFQELAIFYAFLLASSTSSIFFYSLFILAFNLSIAAKYTLAKDSTSGGDFLLII